MADLRKTRESLLLAFSDNLIDDVEFSLLYDVNNSRNDYPYWVYLHTYNKTPDQMSARHLFPNFPCRYH